MNWIWRALVAGLLLGGTVIWAPMMATAAPTPNSETVRGPATQDNSDNDDKDNVDDDNTENENVNTNDNLDDNENLNDNASDNDNDSNESSVNPGNTTTVPTDASQAGMQVQNGELTIDLWRSNDHPVANTPFSMSVKGSGAPIDRVWLWAEAPGGDAGPAGDDFALAGEHAFSCGGANPCEQGWQFVARNVGYYTIHARVRDTSGREVQTDWFVLFSSNPRSG